VTYASEVLADAPTRYWRLLDTSGTTAVDSSGNSGDGTYTGTGVTLQDTGYVAGDKAVTFDGSSGAMDVSVSEASATKVTFECWFNWPTYGTDSKGITEWANTNTTAGIFVVPNEATGKFRVGSRDSGGVYDTSEFTRPSAGWHHLVVVCDVRASTGQRSIPYIDGSPVSYTKANTATSSSAAFAGTSQTLKLGGLISAANFSAVTLSEVALYVGTALSATRIAAHYAARDTAVSGAVVFTATSTLTTTATDTLPAVALAAASSLTTAVSGVLSGAASLAATSSLTATATITKSGAVALVASSTLTPTMAPATVVSLTAVSSLSADAATLLTATVALSATSTLTTAGTVVVSGVVILGAVTVAAGLAVTLDTAQPGTLANPYAASDSDTRSLDFASALFVATEPVAITGPPAAPSIWYEFTESQVADWLASTSGFAHGADIELYAGPPGAGPDDLTFIATDGSSLVTLGAVTVSALVTTVATSLRAELVDLGAVAVVATPAVAVVLS
jgi:hypothetical protein